jgi:microcystin-dependent protein
MSTPFLGQIQSFGFNFAPSGWTQCNGQLMAINQNQALFSLLGTTFGGDGISTFALPNLQGRLGISQGPGFVLGAVSGEVNHTLSIAEVPAHVHPMVGCSATGTSGTPVGNFPAPAASGASLFGTPVNTTLGTGSSPSGGSQPHPNMPPYLTINFCIALQGIFPSRN